MTDLEISKALALAIGWDTRRVGVSETFGEMCIRVQYDINRTWQVFDYRDWNVISPIAAKYSAFPASICSGNFIKAKKQGYTDVVGWEVYMFDYKNGALQRGKWLHYRADTPQKAIALAVIGAKK
jgi:hypothetical protein